MGKKWVCRAAAKTACRESSVVGGDLMVHSSVDHKVHNIKLSPNGPMKVMGM